MKQLLRDFIDQVKTSSRKGFTLIELLVVIGILGVLAAALIATLDPFEQLNRGQDTTMKQIATEFVSANVRYYSSHNALPWFSTANGGANCYTGGTTLNGVALTNLTTCITALVSDGELKPGFANSPNLSSVTVSNPSPQVPGGTAEIIACFRPKSKAQQKDPNTRFTVTGSNGTGCKSSGGSTDCYWCAQ